MNLLYYGEHDYNAPGIKTSFERGHLSWKEGNLLFVFPRGVWRIELSWHLKLWIVGLNVAWDIRGWIHVSLGLGPIYFQVMRQEGEA